ncbi:MAG TPA: glucose-6-phosphate dehydrogenase, partial [Solirubrobacteraceae bacterium]|nr:glucose-6-phosphate dehydrogenase [Solirubrobacteraceae bacterium]
MLDTNEENIAYPAPGSLHRRAPAPVIPAHVVTLFGATGDLARRKLIPGMAVLSESQLAPALRVIGISLEDLSDAAFREFARETIHEFCSGKLTDDQIETFVGKLRFVPQRAGPGALAQAVAAAESELGEGSGRLHYLSVPPRAALSVIETLGEAGLVDRARVIMEKPFGNDLESAVALNASVHQTFNERQIFRIDHFLGKEPAQNILAFRFGNGLFEPIWNRNFIDHIQIDIPETLSVDSRLDFYEATGA